VLCAVRLNPHNWLTALSPPHTPNRRWRCEYCQLEGLYDELREVACYPPCEYCGQTPECAIDCHGIAEALGRPDVHLIVGPPKGNA